MDDDAKRTAGIASIHLYRKAGITLEHVPFVIGYAITLYMCVDSIGDAYREALEKYSITEPAEGEEYVPPCFPLPGEHMPSFISRLLLGVTICLHILLFLAQHWSVAFHCLIKYRSVQLKEATHARVEPMKHQGKAELVEVNRTAKGVPYINFQKQIFRYNKDVKENFGFVKVQCPDNLALHKYTESEGIGRNAVKAKLMQFGENRFEIVIPSFSDLYVEGLLKPFSVFQIFCVLLWCMDEYWQYSLFTLVMILVFEGTVVMSRRKNLTSLRGMNNEVRVVHVLRDNEWTMLSAHAILPGDLISVTKGNGVDQDIVPCDCLILQGSAVVNEATLTGESVPRIKEAIVVDEYSKDELLDIQNKHKVHVLWGGTKLLQHRTGANDTTPDGGCLCYVLRTGFDSSQGRLVRMIQFSSENVTGNTFEAFLLILFLLIFALIASGYVLKKGLEAGRDHFDLLLHCILIITSVIPPELHMQMSLAVNTSLLALTKLLIYCTEPFRIPMAGKVDCCLFDKTGTITTDELVAAGVVAVSQFKEAGPHYKLSQRSTSAPAERHQMSTMPLEASVVIGGCHSLVEIDGKVNGDPVEMTALKAIKWTFDPVTATSSPSKMAQTTWPSSIKPTVKILHRYHFASKLQRMSVIAKVSTDPSCALNGLCVLSKGSPEMIGRLLKPGTKPSWYDSSHQELARQGMRIIALAYRPCPKVNVADVAELPRAEMETDLIFVGFLAFRCLLRKDSKDVLEALKESSHDVTMVTGDALLTAVHVATEVGITSSDRSTLLYLSDDLEWCNVDSGVAEDALQPTQIPRLAKTFGLCMTGDALERATTAYPDVWNYTKHIRVFARMSPAGKERLMTSLKDNKHYTLMCGDGANDVGALKQADVGVALLSGFGSANAKKDEGKQDEKAPVPVEAPKKKAPQTRAELQKQMQLEIAEEEERLKAEGNNSFMAKFLAIKNVTERNQKKQRERMRKSGGSGLAAHAAMLASDDLEDGSVPMVKLGDASIAAPFTSKKPSIQSTLDVIKQGRCALVTTIQMYQIMALNCLISSYSLSALYLDGIKSGDHQMTARGLLMTVSFLSISRASPLKKLSSVRPLNSIFHPALFLSLVGQFAIHLVCMMYVKSMAEKFMPADWTPRIEGKFEPNLINSVVFLTECVQQVGVFAVNYKGQPFMTSITENKFLLYSLAFCGLGAFLAASNYLPEFNKLLQLVEYPSEGFRNEFMVVLIVNFVGTIIWDRLMLLIFSPSILIAGMKSISRADIRRMIYMVAIVLGVMYYIGTLDPEVWEEIAREMEENE